jgi:hypothetical protein
MTLRTHVKIPGAKMAWRLTSARVLIIVALQSQRERGMSLAELRGRLPQSTTASIAEALTELGIRGMVIAPSERGGAWRLARHISVPDDLLEQGHAVEVDLRADPVAAAILTPPGARRRWSAPSAPNSVWQLAALYGAAYGSRVS